MEIVEATTDHLTAIVNIYNEAIAERSATCDLEPWSREDRLSWFEAFDDRHPIFAGTVEGAVCCYGCLSAYSPRPGYRYAVEHSVYVAKAARGNGYGSAMLGHLVDVASSRGYRYMEGGVFAHNESSLALHIAHGFQEMGRKREVANLDGRWADVVIMVRLLKAPH